MEKKRTNKNVKVRGNGEGTIYFSETLNKYVAQYVEPSTGKRKTLTQRKNEGKKEFKDRFNKIMNDINQGTYIQKRNDSIRNILEKHIEQKFNDGIIKGNTFGRDIETLSQLGNCCSNIIDIPIQNVSLDDIQKSKENMKKYASSGINRMWRLLKKAFSIASSPSVGLIRCNIMNDENLKKPISEIGTKKVFPLTEIERQKLNSILDNEERYSKYRNIVKIEWLTGMRIGEVLSRSINDINKEKKELHIHNTLTRDKNNNIIIGEHTKTYNKETGIDEGERYFPIFPELKIILDEELSKNITNIHGLLFWNYKDNTFIHGKDINSWLERINKKYNISNKTLHNHRLRHDRITQWKEENIDIKAIQYLAGHVEDSDVTDDYIDISQEYAFKELKKTMQ